MKTKLIKKLNLPQTFRSMAVGESIKLSTKISYNTVKGAVRVVRQEGLNLTLKHDGLWYKITRQDECANEDSPRS